LVADPAHPPFSEVQCMLQLCYEYTAEMSNYLNYFLALAMCLLTETNSFTRLPVRYGRVVLGVI